jgi:uncharacterized membrane protein
VTTRLSTIWLLCVFCVTAFAFSPTNAASVTETSRGYVFTDLGYGQAVAINNLGQVIVQASERKSFVWIPSSPNGTSGTFWDMGLVLPNEHVDSEFGTETIANDINDRGEIVGISGSGWGYKGFSSAVPFKTKVGEKLDKTCILKPEQCPVPRAINNRGVIVGEFAAASSSHAIKWSPGGQAVSLGKLPRDTKVSFTACAALDVNDRGTIVGYSEGHAWRLDGKHKRDLGEGSANAVNNDGVVVGGSGGRACIWIGSRKRLLDGTYYRESLSGDLENSYSLANDINDNGEVVGVTSAYRPANSTFLEGCAALWSGGRRVSLNGIGGLPEGWMLTSALAINNKGQIVGYGQYSAPGGHWFGPASRAFLLTPIASAGRRKDMQHK